jgi:hypothetical protein
MQAPDVLHLKVMDQFVSSKMWVPAAGTNDNAKGSDVVSSVACEAEALRTCCRRAEDVSWNVPNFSNPRLYEADRLIPKKSSLF